MDEFGERGKASQIAGCEGGNLKKRAETCVRCNDEVNKIA